jgi:galactokinase
VTAGGRRALVAPAAGGVIAFAPGRVNLIGEHTDYNGGLALPFAIAAGVTVSAEPLAEPRVEVRADDLGEEDAFPLSAPPPTEGWRAFARGAVAELQRGGHALRGARLEVSGDLPQGAGLSSSAALEVALCLALLAVAGRPAGDPVALARLCSRIENDWVGAQTGLLDQLASLCAQPEMALRIDFATVELRAVPLRLPGHRLVTLDSGEAHSLADPGSGYRRRRAECAEACERLGITSLSDAAQAGVEALRALPAPLDHRVRHVLTENQRVEAAIEALDSGDMPALGRLLDASHASLRDDYEVSTPAVDATVARLRDAGALGARIVGGGFGGMVLALFPAAAEAPEGAVELKPGGGARML